MPARRGRASAGCSGPTTSPPYHRTTSPPEPVAPPPVAAYSWMMPSLLSGARAPGWGVRLNRGGGRACPAPAAVPAGPLDERGGPMAVALNIGKCTLLGNYRENNE